MVYFTLLNSATVAQKQPQTVHKQMSIAVFQQRCIYKNEWQVGCGPRASLPTLGLEHRGHKSGLLFYNNLAAKLWYYSFFGKMFT